MAVVDILVPQYRLPQPLMWEATNQMMAFSACKCTMRAIQTAHLSKGRVDPREIHHPSECPKGKHDIFMPPRLSSSVIHWTRNVLLEQRRPNCDYVLFMDDDIVPEPDYLDRLLAHKKDIVGGLCTQRQDPPRPTIRQWMEETQNYGALIEWPHGGLIEVDAIGTGFLLLSRRVIEDVARAYHPKEYAKDGRGWWFRFKWGPLGGEFGEDISFSWKAQRIGFQIYCDTSVTPGHVGDYPYSIKDFFEHQKAYIEGVVGLTEEAKAVRTLKATGA